jgi:hypothetical protein
MGFLLGLGKELILLLGAERVLLLGAERDVEADVLLQAANTSGDAANKRTAAFVEALFCLRTFIKSPLYFNLLSNNAMITAHCRIDRAF